MPAHLRTSVRIHPHAAWRIRLPCAHRPTNAPPDRVRPEDRLSARVVPHPLLLVRHARVIAPLRGAARPMPFAPSLAHVPHRTAQQVLFADDVAPALRPPGPPPQRREST